MLCPQDADAIYTHQRIFECDQGTGGQEAYHCRQEQGSVHKLDYE